VVRVDIRRGWDLQVTELEYALHPIGVPRPASGRRVVEVRCGTCESPVRCAVDSPRALRRRRSRWAAAFGGLAGGLVTVNAAVIGLLVSSFPGDTTGIVVLVLVLGSPVTLVATVLAVIALHRALRDDGIRLVDPSGPHSLRREGDWRQVTSEDTFHEPPF
jgi:hypothetical protein